MNSAATTDTKEPTMNATLAIIDAYVRLLHKAAAIAAEHAYTLPHTINDPRYIAATDNVGRIYDNIAHLTALGLAEYDKTKHADVDALCVLMYGNTGR